MPDIRDVLKGLSPDDRALYAEVRTVMRRAYLAAHAAKLPIDQYTIDDDAFLDLIDIKIATLFDRAGVFDSGEKGGHLPTIEGAKIEAEIRAAGESVASRLIKQPIVANGGWGKTQ